MQLDVGPREYVRADPGPAGGMRTRPRIKSSKRGRSLEQLPPRSVSARHARAPTRRHTRADFGERALFGLLALLPFPGDAGSGPRAEPPLLASSSA